MATPKIIADFETQLSTAVSVGDTSFTLSSATDDDGTALPTGLYYFTVDNGSSNKEYLAGTLTGTSVASVVSVSRQGTETSGAARAHRVGASVIISDFLTYKKYMDEIALVSAPDADTNTKGVLEGATLAEVRAGTASGGTGAALAVTPDVLDDLPTQDEKAALAGTAGSPSTSNKFVTEDGIVTGFSKLIDTDTSTTEIANNTTTETAIFTTSIAGGLLSTANGIRFTIYISNLDQNGETLTLRLKYGSTTIATVTSVDTTDASFAEDLEGTISGVLLAAGTTSSQLGNILMDLSKSADPETAVLGVRKLDAGTASEDSTGALNLSVTAQWSGADSACDLVPAGVVVEQLS